MTAFQSSLAALGFATYADYLESDHWKDTRERYRCAPGFSQQCAVCKTRKHIQLHHHTYVRLGREDLTDLIPLCRKHHEAVHEWLIASGKVFVEFTHEAIVAIRGALGIAKPPASKRRKMKDMTVPELIEKCAPKEHRKELMALFRGKFFTRRYLFDALYQQRDRKELLNLLKLARKGKARSAAIKAPMPSKQEPIKEEPTKRRRGVPFQPNVLPTPPAQVSHDWSLYRRILCDKP